MLVDVYYFITSDGELCHSDEFYHHGIKGMKWGVRRFQRRDGTRTPAGKRRLQDTENQSDSKQSGKNSGSNSSKKSNYKKAVKIGAAVAGDAAGNAAKRAGSAAVNAAKKSGNAARRTATTAKNRVLDAVNPLYEYTPGESGSTTRMIDGLKVTTGFTNYKKRKIRR